MLFYMQLKGKMGRKIYGRTHTRTTKTQINLAVVDIFDIFENSAGRYPIEPRQ